ncbi:MFS transporter [Kribbella sp. NPDC051770]|uniref:MFS transporter n=1 Tax=Kribbella sp. NPDC051770 TaxID=3155413 RepID=UPI003430B0FB
MTLTLHPTVRTGTLRARLAPLQLMAFLQGIAFWVPVEKLFMTEIGFDAAAMGVLAAAYAGLVPAAEVLSGVLADRWSRRGVLVVAAVALLVAVLIGALSQNVVTYLVAGTVLGVYFALYSGTVEAVVYDSVLEQTGTSTAYEREIGRIRLIESAALVTSALAGGWIASVSSTRLTYFVTLPFVAGSLIALSRFREPRLHETGERSPLREHLRVTVRAILHRGRLVPVATAAVLAALILQAMYEFGPLWLLELDAPAGFYGPFWAGVVSALGLGGLLAGRLHLNRRLPAATVALVMLACSGVLLTSGSLAVLTVAIVTLTVLVVVIGIHVSHLVHDAVDSTIRTGVASGISAVSWLLFTPFALGFGAVTQETDVYGAGWLLAGAVVLAAGALLWVARHRSLA